MGITLQCVLSGINLTVMKYNKQYLRWHSVLFSEYYIWIFFIFQHTVRCDIASISAPNVFNQPTNLAEYFYLNPYECLLTLRESLTTIGVNSVVLTVQATDDGIPQRLATFNAQVTIDIIRNENNPFFISTPYETTIPEDRQLGSLVLTVTARDNDNNVSIEMQNITAVNSDFSSKYHILNLLHLLLLLTVS